MDVDALVALQPDQPRAARGGQRLGHLGLADAGLALEQQRLLEGLGEVDRGGERPVGQVALAGQRTRNVIDGSQPAAVIKRPGAQHAAPDGACSPATR